MKRLFIFIAFFCLGLLGHYRLDGFQVSKIYSCLSHQEQWDFNSLSADQAHQVNTILDQKFYYLNRGHQCFVFESEDQKYVLKLINHERFKLPVYSKLLAFLPWLKSLKNKRGKRLHPSFISFKLAYEKLKKETGLIFLQLNQTKDFQKKIVVVDKIKIEHTIDLHKVQFMIQKKAEMIYPTLQRLGNSDNDYEFKAALRSFAKIINTRCEQLISDDDLDVQINYGFINNEAILIDPGRLFMNEQLSNFEVRKKELLKSTKLFRRWLHQTFPQYVLFFENALFNQYEEFSQEAL